MNSGEMAHQIAEMRARERERGQDAVAKLREFGEEVRDFVGAMEQRAAHCQGVSLGKASAYRHAAELAKAMLDRLGMGSEDRSEVR